MSSNSKLVWSNDPKDKKEVEVNTTKQKPIEATSSFIKSNNWVAIFRIEKNGRNGKTVTVIDNLPKHESFLKELCKELKSRCGSGGTYSMEHKEGLIEIQGDKREPIKAIFTKKGYKFKGM